MHTNRQGKQLEDQIHIMLDKVLDDEQDFNCNTHFNDEEEPSFLDKKLNKKNTFQNNKCIDGQKLDKFRSTRHLEDLDYINNIPITLSCHSASATKASVDYCNKNRNNSLNLNEFGYNEDTNFNEQGIENLIIENNPLDNFEFEIQGNNINYNNILNLSDRIDEESFSRLKILFMNIIFSQNGSRLLQKCLKKTEKNILKLISDEIIVNLSKTLSNPNAEEFFQKLYTLLDINDKMRFLIQLKFNFLDLSQNNFTSKPLYVFITQYLNNEGKAIIVECIREKLLEMCYVYYANIGFICSQNSR
jgi:hypothetical protein